MKSTILLATIATMFAYGCEPEHDGQDTCTLETIGDETGSKLISVELLIPEYRMIGAEITNGGILVINPDCDYPLNAFLADETGDYLIDQAKNLQWLHTPSGSKVAQAKLWIWRFRDSSGKPRFFVENVFEIADPKTPPLFSDKEYYRRIESVR